MMDSSRRERMEAIRHDQCAREKDCGKYWSYDLGNEPKHQVTPLDKLKEKGVSSVIDEHGRGGY